ncbi:MAG: metal ABC transporter ATP-binding protein [Peptostreptococcaceae bacterium]
MNNSCEKCGSDFCLTKISNLSVKKGNNTILEDINLHLHCGELVALIGVNGCGKSTLLKSIIGENEFSGSLEFFSEDDKQIKKPIIGYVPQKLDFDYTSPITVNDLFNATYGNKSLLFSKRNKEKTLEVLRKVDSEKLIDKKLGFLSGGELQRVLLALSLTPLPNILLLDEPVSGVDQAGLKIFYEIVSNLRNINDLCIVLVSHDFSLVKEYADKVVFLNNKSVELVDTPQRVFNNRNVQEIFRLNFG